MEDGVKGSNDSPPESKVALKAGWLKKSSGLLGLWKDRYVQILKTQLLVCESEDDQKCLETLELANYEKCQDNKAFMKRKKHFSLIPTPGTKVPEVKFQAKNAEERDDWIQNLNGGINRGKNKILDVVKIDTSCSLDHVTRDRVKVGATKRRPPTRIHLKEVAEAAADDSLRLGLESLDTGILTVVTPLPKPKDAEPQSQKEQVKIPMPPTKPNQLQTSEGANPDTNSEDKATGEPSPRQKERVKIPMPPTKPNQLQTSEGVNPDTNTEDKATGASSPRQKERVKIPMPPTKPNELEASEVTNSEDKAPSAPSPRQKERVKIPMPPTKPNELQTSEATIGEDEAPRAPSPRQKERVKIPMPPTKPNQLQAAESTIPDTIDSGDKAPGAPNKEETIKIPMPPTKPTQTQTLEITVTNTTDSKDQMPSAPTPPPKSLKENVHAREKLLSENEQSYLEEESAYLVLHSGSKEDLRNVVNSPPKPPPKIISDKMKIKWVGSVSDSEEKEDLEERGSKENLVDFESDDMECPSSSHRKVLSETLKHELNSSIDSLESQSMRMSKDLAKDEDGFHEASIEGKSTENKEKSKQEEKSALVKEATGQPAAYKNEDKVPCRKYRKKSKNLRSPKDEMEYKAKASSMGDLLSTQNENGNDLPMSYITKDHLQQVELKLARGKERTKALLNQVMMGQLGNSAEGNGMEGNPETILHELMTQLQEASEVLQVIKEKGQRNDLNTPEEVTEKQKQKELLAIQRRSVPF